MGIARSTYYDCFAQRRFWGYARQTKTPEGPNRRPMERCEPVLDHPLYLCILNQPKLSGKWSSGGLFWLLAGFVLCCQWLVSACAFPLVSASQALTVMLLQTALEHRYRQSQSIRSQDAIVSNEPQQSQLTVSKEYASYISDATLAGNGGGFEPGIPVIDLSGQSPTLLFAVDAENIVAERRLSRQFEVHEGSIGPRIV